MPGNAEFRLRPKGADPKMPVVNDLSRIPGRGLALVLLLGGVGSILAGSPPKPPAEPAKITVSVSPEALSAGEVARVAIRLQPKDGVKINRYPQIKIVVPELGTWMPGAAAAIGDRTPPPPDKIGTNYYGTVDPLEFDLPIRTGAPKGRHAIEGQLTYFYCVAASGFCAPAHVPVSIPIVVH